jgi:formylglycine-generating enzyme required for sulfatase activity
MKVKFNPVASEDLQLFFDPKADIQEAVATDAVILKDTSGNKKWSIQHNTNTVKQDFYSPEPTNKISNGGFETDLSGWTTSYPTNGVNTAGSWVLVPKNTDFTSGDFYVMKYQGKCDKNGDGIGDTTNMDATYHVMNNQTYPVGSGGRTLVSSALGAPIAYINQGEAAAACTALGAKYHLITNNEWMTIARNAELVNSNWSLNTVGLGYLYAGHNDNVPPFALEASTNDANKAAYTDLNGATEALTSATNTASGQSGTTGNQVRTLTLSNGSVVWDLAGNVWEWTNNIHGSTIDTTGAWVDWNHVNVAAGARALYGSNTYLSNQGSGQVYGGAIGSGFLRGGAWPNMSYAGAFALSLHYATSARDSPLGFRCSSDPVAISQLSSAQKYSGTQSVKIDATNALFGTMLLQSINVGDTSTYTLTAYAYTTGAAVTTADLDLYYDTGELTTTFTDMGSGWYRLQGTLTGVNALKNFGVSVHAGKTVYVDTVTLQAGTGATVEVTLENSSSGLANFTFENKVTAGEVISLIDGNS